MASVPHHFLPRKAFTSCGFGPALDLRKSIREASIRASQRAAHEMETVNPKEEEEEDSTFAVCVPTQIIGSSTESRGYSLLKQLGSGQSSSVWLARDNRFGVSELVASIQELVSSNPTSNTFGKQFDRLLRKCFCAIKIFRADDDLVDSMIYERDLLEFLRKKVSADPSDVIRVGVTRAESFCFVCPSTDRVHHCLVFDVCGPSLDMLMQVHHFQGIDDVAACKRILRSILEGLELLTRLQIVHSDLKPENLLFDSPSPDIIAMMCKWIESSLINRGFVDVAKDFCELQRRFLAEAEEWSGRVLLSDFGLSYIVPVCFRDNAAEDCSDEELALLDSGGYTKGALIQTREYRSPEIILGTDFNCSIDMWSLGCVAYEMICGRMLFDPKRRVSGDDEEESLKDALHLCEMMQVLGVAPNEYINCCDGVYIDKFFCPKKGGLSFLHAELAAELLNENGVDDSRRDVVRDLCERLGEQEGMLAADFVASAVSWCPWERATPSQLLSHPWLLSD